MKDEERVPPELDSGDNVGDVRWQVGGDRLDFPDIAELDFGAVLELQSDGDCVGLFLKAGKELGGAGQLDGIAQNAQPLRRVHADGFGSVLKRFRRNQFECLLVDLDSSRFRTFVESHQTELPGRVVGECVRVGRVERSDAETAPQSRDDLEVVRRIQVLKN